MIYRNIYSLEFFWNENTIRTYYYQINLKERLDYLLILNRLGVDHVEDDLELCAYGMRIQKNILNYIKRNIVCL